tara:strand:+ start:76 stop:483 length:408 start_codon:yes stop_codon:yes gene_type:complete
MAFEVERRLDPFHFGGFGYDQQSLDELWKVLQEADSSNDQESPFERLVEVPFTIDLHLFIANHFHEVTQHMERTSIVTVDPEEALELLSEGRISNHHLSCRAFRAPGKANSALCIHYKDNGRYFALALPGVNYQT